MGHCGVLAQLTLLWAIQRIADAFSGYAGLPYQGNAAQSSFKGHAGQADNQSYAAPPYIQCSSTLCSHGQCSPTLCEQCSSTLHKQTEGNALLTLVAGVHHADELETRSDEETQVSDS